MNYLRSNNFINKILNQTINDNIEIISIHIPKTAGTSFRKLLELNYENSFEWIKRDNKLNCFCEKKYCRLNKGIRVIHGHFPVFKDLTKYYPNAKLITWIRDPVERLISHYYFFKFYPRHGNKQQDFMLDLDLSIIQFAKIKQIGYFYKRFLKYLEELKYEDFYFIGIVEEFDNYIDILADKLGWQYKDKFFERKSGNRIDPTEKELLELKEILSEEIKFYDSIRVKNRKLYPRV